MQSWSNMLCRQTPLSTAGISRRNVNRNGRGPSTIFNAVNVAIKCFLTFQKRYLRSRDRQIIEWTRKPTPKYLHLRKIISCKVHLPKILPWMRNKYIYLFLREDFRFQTFSKVAKILRVIDPLPQEEKMRSIETTLGLKSRCLSEQISNQTDWTFKNDLNLREARYQ